MNCLFKNMRTMCLAMIAGTLLLTVSCKDDDEATVTGFALDQTEVGFLNHGGAIEIRVATDETWTAISENDWCMLTPANGVGSVVCVIKADSSYLYKERYGKITFYSESGKSVEVAINQMGYEPTIQLTSEEVTIPSYAELDKSYIDIEATSNVAFEVVAPEDLDWLTLEGESKYTPSTTIPRKQKFRFRFKTYTEFDKVRSAQIKFNQTGKPITRAGEIQKELLKKIVTITQEKAPLIIPSREGDSLALLAMSRTLNLDGSGWVTSRPITHWNNEETEERTYHYSYGDIDKDSTEVRVISLRFSMFDTKESVPYQIKYLTELESFSAVGNSNAFTKKIVLGPEITTLKNLKSLSLMGYGISEFPPEMKNMTQLEELDMNGNNFLKLPMDILKGMTGLKYLNFGGNRVSGSVLNLQTDIPKKYTLETIGMGGNLPKEIFEMDNLEYLYLSYNYFYGSIPDMGYIGGVGKHNIMPNLKMLSLNLNRFTGKLPDWILWHPKLACWNPFILLFNQEGYDNLGKLAGFSNEPAKMSEFPEGANNRVCPDDEDEDAITTALNLPSLTKEDIETVPLNGHWRYYKLRGETWGTKFNNVW